MRSIRLAAAAGLSALLALAGCGGSGPAGAPTDSPAPVTELQITLAERPDATARTWTTLRCDPPGGAAGAHAACAALAAIDEPFAPTPADMACTEIYGGPETATVTGTYRGQPVDTTFARTNGCEIARWDRFAPVLAVLATS